MWRERNCRAFGNELSSQLFLVLSLALGYKVFRCACMYSLILLIAWTLFNAREVFFVNLFISLAFWHLCIVLVYFVVLSFDWALLIILMLFSYQNN